MVIIVVGHQTKMKVTENKLEIMPRKRMRTLMRMRMTTRMTMRMVMRMAMRMKTTRWMRTRAIPP
jgi:hypothetical protein